MLKLPDDERSFLISLGALTVDAEGNDVLAGLTAEESHFLVDFKSRPATPGDGAQRWLYHQFLAMHLGARLDAINKRTGCPFLGDGVDQHGFGEGDIVRLKCGGPDISVVGTIEAYPFKDGPGPGVFCVWEENNRRHEQVFPLCAIEAVPAKRPPQRLTL